VLGPLNPRRSVEPSPLLDFDHEDLREVRDDTVV